MVMATNSAADKVRSELARLAAARMNDDEFRWEAAAVLRRAVGFDGWCMLLTDPGARLPTRDIGEVVDLGIRRLARRLPGMFMGGRGPARRPVVVTSEATGGDLAADPLWREVFGPAGIGDHLSAPLLADGTCWGQLHIYRDSSGAHFGKDDAELVAAVTPLLAARLRDGLRAPASPDDPAPEQGTVILDEELSLVAATPAARDWIGRLGLQPPSAAEPLPGVFYVVATRVALARTSGADPPPAARVRLRDSGGHWVVVRAAPLLGGAGGYAVTLESARSPDLAPLLMRAWSLTARERDVAQLAIDGLTSDDIARELFISAHTVRDHVKAIFTKTGVSRRQDLVAALAGAATGSRVAG